MNACERALLIVGLTVFGTVSGASRVLAQAPSKSLTDGVLAKAFSVFAVDEAAKDSRGFAQSDRYTVAAGPIQLHRRGERSRPERRGWDERFLGGMLTERRVQLVKPGINQGQSDSRSASHRRDATIRQSVHESIFDETGASQTRPFAGEVMSLGPVEVTGPPSPSHQVIRSPSRSRDARPTEMGTYDGTYHHGVHRDGVHSESLHEKARAVHEKHRETHPDHSSIRRRIQPEPPTIPGGREQEMWKQPYSYGYFGASGDRHWLMQHGYRDRYTQWTRR